MGSRKSPTSLWEREGWGVEDKTGIFRIAIFNFILRRNFRQNEPWPLNPGKIVLHPMELPKTKTFLITIALEMPILFLLTSGISKLYFFSIWGRSFMSSTLPLFLNFFWNTSSCHATKIVIWFFRWNSLVQWRIPEKI